jgi:ATP/maltotriose-dependent transcriptional regulator MalT
VVSELAEAAARTGDVAAARAALAWLSERTRVSPTDWALGIEARVRALLSGAGLRAGEDADRCHRESIRRLGRTRLRAELARAHLLYGEWLRREHRRAEAREQLRTAHEMLDTMGMEAFAERARRELTSAGEPVRNASREPAEPNSVPAGVALTAQEALVARLARDGLSNPEIGSRLFISSRGQLYRVLPSDPVSASPR